MKSLSIVRTAVGSTVVAGFIHELRARGVRVIGTDTSEHAVGKQLCDAFYRVPGGSDPAFVSAMLGICEKEKAIATIISGPEEETLALAEHRTEFEKLGVQLFLTDIDRIRDVQDKKKFSEIATEIGLETPSRFVTAGELRAPYVVKPRRGRGSHNVRIERASGADAALDPELVYEEYIEGIEYSVDCFFDPAHRPLLLVPRARIKTDSGIAIITRTVRSEEITEEVLRLADRCSFVGPFCIQCIERRGERYYTDCNHRFGGASIVSMRATPKFLETFIALCRGEPYTADPSFIEGLLMKRYYAEVYERT